MKHELEAKIKIRIKETEISTIEEEQEHKEGLGQEVETNAEDERRNRRDPLKEPRHKRRRPRWPRQGPTVVKEKWVLWGARKEGKGIPPRGAQEEDQDRLEGIYIETQATEALGNILWVLWDSISMGPKWIWYPYVVPTRTRSQFELGLTRGIYGAQPWAGTASPNGLPNG